MKMVELLEECFVLVIHVVPYEIPILGADITNTGPSLYCHLSKVVWRMLVYLLRYGYVRRHPD